MNTKANPSNRVAGFPQLIAKQRAAINRDREVVRKTKRGVSEFKGSDGIIQAHKRERKREKAQQGSAK